MTPFPAMDTIIEITYLVATALFILSLKWMSSPTTARRGVWAGELGMLLAVGGTLLNRGIVDYKWMVDRPGARHHHRHSPRQSAHDGGAAADRAQPRLRRACASRWSARRNSTCARPHVPKFMMSVLSMEVILGSLTFTGSLMAAGKLQEILPQRPITYKGQNIVNLGMLAAAILVAGYLVLHPDHTYLFPIIVVVPLLFGVLMIIPIGGADMPTVISLLNSYAGLSAAAMGFVLDSKLLIVAGALDGASGLILSVNMSKAMNRSFSNVLFGAFGQEQAGAKAGVEDTTGSQRHARRGCRNSCRGKQGGHRSRLRDGCGAGAAQSARTLRHPHQARRRREVRHSPGGGTHARTHERAAGRSRYPLRQAARHGRNQRRFSADRRGAHHRRQ